MHEQVVIFLAVMAVFVALQMAIIHSYKQRVNLQLKPWQNLKPDASFRVLFAGDSTAVGTGLTDNRFSTSGLFSQDYPDVHVENHSVNGMPLKDLIEVLQSLQGQKFNLAVFHIGGNDILYFTPWSRVRLEHQRVLALAKNIATHIVILHSGDIGDSKMFLWPLSFIFTQRTLTLRDIYMKAQDDRVAYIDIITNNKRADLTDVYADDQIHLNQKGYAL